jgi:hypothetical protein
VAGVGSTGIVTGVSPGTATITATVQGVSGQAVVSVIGPPQPIAPTNVQAMPVSSTQMLVTWDDNSDNETGFRILRSTVGSGSPGGGAASATEVAGQVGANETEFLDDGLTPGESYQYSVQACNGDACSDQSEPSDDGTTFEPVDITTTSLAAGIRGTPYTESLAAVGGDGSYLWSVPSGSLPTGVNLNAATGQLFGTPIAAGTSDFDVGVTSGDGQTDTQALSISVQDPLVITTSSLPAGSDGFAYSVRLEATGGDETFSWALNRAPEWLSVDPPTGALSGTAQTGEFEFEARVSSGGQRASRVYSVVVYDALTIVTESLPMGVAGHPYAADVEAAGGTGTYAWSLGSGPPWLSIGAGSGTLSGTAAEGEFTVEVDVLSGNQSVSRSYTLAVYPLLELLTASLPDGVEGEAYSETLEASGGDGTYEWELLGAPGWLSVDPASGVLSGVAAPGEFEFEATVRSGGQEVTRSLKLSAYAPLQIVTTTLPEGVKGVAYSETVVANGGDGTYAWALSSGSLPAGLTLSSAGVLGGTPATPGTSDFEVQVTSGAQSATQALSLTVADATLAVVTTELPVAAYNTAYTGTLLATGGDGTYTWTLHGGTSLPAGLTMDGGGTISGTPTSGGVTNFEVQVASNGQTATQALSITVTVPTPVITTESPLPGGLVGTAYSESLTATGGDDSYSWALHAGTSLPSGLNLSAGGQISGTPASGGETTFEVQLTSGGATATKTFTIGIGAVGTPNEPAGYLKITERAFDAFYEDGWNLETSSGAVLRTDETSAPRSPNNVLRVDYPSGMPGGISQIDTEKATNLYKNNYLSFYVKLSPNFQGHDSGTNKVIFNWIHEDPAVFLSFEGTDAAGLEPQVRLQNMPAGETRTALDPNVPGQENVKISRGEWHHWELVFLANQPGSSNGTVKYWLDGTLIGEYTDVQFSGATDGAIWERIEISPIWGGTGDVVADNMWIEIDHLYLSGSNVGGPPSVTTGFPMPAGTLSQAYSQQLTASGGDGSYSWSLASGSLPPGVSLSGAGVVSGTPTVAGTYDFTAQVTSNGQTDSKALRIFVGASGWSNEPAGYTTLTERPFNALVEDGWLSELTDGASIQTDATAPRSPSNILRSGYPAASPGGESHVDLEKITGGYTKNYLSFYIKFSDNFQGHTSSTNKLIFNWIHGNPATFLSAEGAGPSQLLPTVRLQNMPAAESREYLYPNVEPSDPELTRGIWHRWEVLYIANTCPDVGDPLPPCSADGVVRFWLNGILIGEYTDVTFSDTDVGRSEIWSVLELSPVWGGTGDTVDEFMWFDIDHLYLSASN